MMTACRNFARRSRRIQKAAMPGSVWQEVTSDKKKYAEALQAIDRAANLAPENQRVHFIRGQVLQHLGRKDEAEAEFAIAKKLMDKGFIEDRDKLEERYVPSPELTQLPN